MNYEDYLKDINNIDDEASGVVESGIFADAKKERARKAQEAMTASTTTMLGNYENSVKDCVTNIRNYRHQLKRVQELLSKLNRAYEYANETGNILPLSHLCGGAWHLERAGIQLPKHDSPLWNVPKEWQPASKDADDL